MNDSADFSGGRSGEGRAAAPREESERLMWCVTQGTERLLDGAHDGVIDTSPLRHRSAASGAQLVEALYVPADTRVVRRVAMLADLYADGDGPVSGWRTWHRGSPL
jgi:hypothetical protein